MSHKERDRTLPGVSFVYPPKTDLQVDEDLNQKQGHILMMIMMIMILGLAICCYFISKNLVVLLLLIYGCSLFGVCADTYILEEAGGDQNLWDVQLPGSEPAILCNTPPLYITTAD